MGTTTCHKLIGGQRPGHQGDQVGICLPKMGVGTRRSETRLLLDSPPHIGETEAPSNTSWPGSPNTRPQTTGATRPWLGRGLPALGPYRASPSQSTSPIPAAAFTAGRV